MFGELGALIAFCGFIALVVFLCLGLPAIANAAEKRRQRRGY